MKSLELFSGSGGLALGTHKAGFEHVALVEWNADACGTLRENVSRNAVTGIDGWNVYQQDISTFDFRGVGAVDLVAGGVPCQPFSIGGKHRGRDDQRDMFPHFVRAIRELRPAAFIIENVRGLDRPKFSDYFQYVRLQLESPSIPARDGESWREHLRRLLSLATQRNASTYSVGYSVLNSANFGVPQIRQRVFIVGYRSDTGLTWQAPLATHSKHTLVVEQATGKYWKRHGLPMPRRYAVKHDRLLLPLLNCLAPWRTVRDAIADLPEPREGRDISGVIDHRLNPGARTYPGHTGSFIDAPSKTLKAGVHGVPGGENMIAFPDGSVRYLTVREAARIQTFPDAWRFNGAWSEAMRQVGNAVPVELAFVVAREVATRLLGAPWRAVQLPSGSVSTHHQTPGWLDT